MDDMLRAILFDFNGVILDDEEYHFESFRRVLEEEGLSISRTDYYRDCLGFNDEQLFQWRLGDPDRIDRAGGMERLVSRKSVYYERLLAEEMRFFPGIRSLIRSVASRYPLGVASMALRREIEFALRRAGILEMFHVIVCDEDVSETKPDPEVYLRALERMNQEVFRHPAAPLLPAECLVIEDSVPGIQAARAAGIPVLAVCNTVGADELQAADWILRDVQGLSVGDIEALVADRYAV